MPSGNAQLGVDLTLESGGGLEMTAMNQGIMSMASSPGAEIGYQGRSRDMLTR